MEYNKLPVDDGDRTIYCAKSVPKNREQRIYYVNGIRTSPKIHMETALKLSELADVKVLGIFNKSGFTSRQEDLWPICRRVLGPIISIPIRLTRFDQIDFYKDVIQCIWDWMSSLLTTYEPKRPRGTLLSRSALKEIAKRIVSYNPCILRLMDVLESDLQTGY